MEKEIRYKETREEIRRKLHAIVEYMNTPDFMEKFRETEKRSQEITRHIRNSMVVSDEVLRKPFNI